ncbi:MAG: hypothetical protein ABSE08_14955 [Syntrophobacteraceae bacterium]|jgi:hypothetical protein
MKGAKNGRKGKKWWASSLAALLLLLSVSFAAPLPSASRDYIDLHGSNGLSLLVFQDHLAGSVTPGYALRTGSFSHAVASATIQALHLPLKRLFPRLIESGLAMFPASKFVDPTIKVRAPPFSAV